MIHPLSTKIIFELKNRLFLKVKVTRQSFTFSCGLSKEFSIADQKASVHVLVDVNSAFSFRFV